LPVDTPEVGTVRKKERHRDRQHKRARKKTKIEKFVSYNGDARTSKKCHVVLYAAGCFKQKKIPQR